MGNLLLFQASIGQLFWWIIAILIVVAAVYLTFRNTGESKAHSSPFVPDPPEQQLPDESEVGNLKKVEPQYDGRSPSHSSFPPTSSPSYSRAGSSRPKG